jgi:hypothetical protein
MEQRSSRESCAQYSEEADTDGQELAFHPDAIGRDDRQVYLEVAARLFHEKERYSPAIEEAQLQILAWRKELLDYMNEKKIDLLVITAGVLGMSGPAIGAATWLPVVSGGDE